MTLTIPIASFDPQHYVEGEPGIQGLVDLVRWNLWKWDNQGQSSCHPLPRSIEDLKKDGLLPSSHPVIPHLVIARTQLLENLSMVSEDLMETLITMPSEPSAYLKLDNEFIIQHLRKASLSNQILPVLCGSAMKNIGTELVMDYIGELLPSPLDVTHEEQGKNPPVRMLAWKVNWDDRKGWMTFVRVYSGITILLSPSSFLADFLVGKLTRQITLLNTNRNQKEKMSKILLLYASEAKEVDELPFGSVGVILGLKHTRTGDTLVSAGTSVSARSLLRDITPPPALISASVIPHSHSDLQPVQDSLASLSRTDPSLRVDIQDGQILVHGLGALHLEIVEGRLRDEWKVNFEFGRRRVSYREGLGTKEPIPDWNIWEGDVGGKHISTKIPIQVRSMDPSEEGDPDWDGNIVVDEKGTPIPIPQSMSCSLSAYIAEGISNALSNSPHSSLPMMHVHVQVGGLKELTTRVPSIVTGATATILRRRFRDAGMGPILEPFVSLRISVNESSLGKVVKDLTEHGGEVVELSESTSIGPSGQEDIGGFSEAGVYIPPEWLSPSGSHTSRDISYGSRMKRSLQGIAPLSQCLDYSDRLRAISEGHGIFEIANAGFKQVSQERKMEILREIGRA